MSWKCCDKEVDTPFCPMCGKVMANEGIAGLLLHVRRWEQRNRKLLAKSIEYERRKPDPEPHIRKHRNSVKNTYEKWHSFRVALEDLIKTANEKESNE